MTFFVNPPPVSDDESATTYLKRVQLKELHSTQKGLKKRTKRDVENLTKSLINETTQYPLFVALVDGLYQIIDGHFRHHVLKEIYGDSHEIDVVVFEGLTLEQAKKQCLVLSARYGEMANIDEWAKTELPSFSIDLVALGFQKEVVEKTKRVDEQETCPACGKPMKKERKVKTFVH